MSFPLSVRWLMPVALLLGLAACSGGSGGGGQFDRGAELLAIEFPDPTTVNAEEETEAPGAAPLNQQIVFRFSGSPNPDGVNTRTIRITESASGIPVPGSFSIDGSVVTFTPTLATRPITPVVGGWDAGGSGFEPGGIYAVRIGPATWPSFLAKVSADVLASHPDASDPTTAFLTFKATEKEAAFLRGLPRRTPRLVDTDPVDGATGVSPNLYSDPGSEFAERRAFHLTFDGPVHPSTLNIGRFAMVDLDDVGGAFPNGLPLGVDVQVLVNEIDRSIIEVMPSGILPFGHLVSLEHPTKIRGMSQVEDAGEETTVAATFTVAAAGASVTDALVEDYDSDGREEVNADELEVGQTSADWDRLDSNVLQAGFAFEGAGELGRFLPPPPGADDEDDRTVILDTSTQGFPLLDGSTPDAPPGYTVVGGIFSFTEIDIPDGVIIQARGPNPLIITATGSVKIAGTILLDGQDGQDDNAFDSAVTSLPGGPAGSGGGRGGEGQPIRWVGENLTTLTLVSPEAGGQGFGPRNLTRSGGRGGVSAMHDRPNENGEYTTDNEIACSETTNNHNNGFKMPGGGGGSFLERGTKPKSKGKGNVRTDGRGNWIVHRKEDSRDWDKVPVGKPGDLPFQDANDDNNFIGAKGEITEIIGGQGGGAGGSALDAYYCGAWCLNDTDPTNDEVCIAEWLNPPTFADSVGDSRGGSGGGGGGAFLLQAIGEILLVGANIDCSGGNGGGGEALGCGNWGGCGAGASGGAILLQSADGVRLKGNTKLRVQGGRGRLAVSSKDYITSCNGRAEENIGTGGNGGHGLVQLQVPLGKTAEVGDNVDITDGAWVDQNNLLNPAEFSSISVAQSRWYDMGRVIARQPGTTPMWSFSGTDALTGLVLTDDDGNVLDADSIDIQCDYLGQLDPLNPGQYREGEEPRSDFIPTNASVKVEFQGADAIVEGSKEVDPVTLTAWETDAELVSGHQFIRYRITFDIAADPKTDLGPFTPRPAVQTFRVRAEF